MSDAIDTIRQTVTDNDVVLFMKGTSDQPQCGFSNQVVRILDHLGVDYRDVNVLADEGIREGVKAFASWPTIPQLYVKGEFIGGCDIVREMFQTGELKTLFADKGVALTA
jgi:monothiol glutaredoxin